MKHLKLKSIRKEVLYRNWKAVRYSFFYEADSWYDQ